MPMLEQVMRLDLIVKRLRDLEHRVYGDHEQIGGYVNIDTTSSEDINNLE